MLLKNLGLCCLVLRITRVRLLAAGDKLSSKGEEPPAQLLEGHTKNMHHLQELGRCSSHLREMLSSQHLRVFINFEI